MSNNPEVRTTLDDAVREVLNLLTGLDLHYAPELDRFRAVTRALNRALRANALEQEWSWYASTESAGPARVGVQEVVLRPAVRPRIVNDDAVRLVDAAGTPLQWAYFLPRDSIHKYRGRHGLWCSVLKQSIVFSRPFALHEDGLDIQVPVMREPTMFRLPDQPEDTDAELVEVDLEILEQPIDFSHPDLIVLRAAYYYAQTDPVMQPRVQTIESQYKDLMYQVMERDESNTDSPYMNDFFVPVQNGLVSNAPIGLSDHPHSDERR